MPRPPKRIKISYQNRHNAAALVPFNAKHCLVTDSSRDFAERDRVSSTRLRKDDLPDGNGRASSRIWLEGQPGLGLRGCVGSQGGSPGPFVFLSVYTSVCHLFFFLILSLSFHPPVTWSLSPGISWSRPDDLSLSRQDLSSLLPQHIYFFLSPSLPTPAETWLAV